MDGFAMSRVLLLDAYGSSSRPCIPPYAYLGAFLSRLGVAHEVLVWRGESRPLRHRLERGEITHIFINAILGRMLLNIKPLVRQIREVSSARIWLGGHAARFIPTVLRGIKGVDHVSCPHPHCNPVGFARELASRGVLADFTKIERAVAPRLPHCKHIPDFTHEHFLGSGPDRFRALNFATSSSCINQCSFCYLRRSPRWVQPLDEVFEDLTYLRDTHDVRYFEFSDDNFAADRLRVADFCRRAEEYGGGLAYFCMASLDSLDEPTMDKLVRSGMKRLFIGIDTFHRTTNRYLGKAYDPVRAREVLKIVRAYPVDLTLAVVLGSPGETHHELEETLAFAREVNPEICFASLLSPYPGTPLFDGLDGVSEAAPKTIEDWALWSDHEMPMGIPNTEISGREYVQWQRSFSSLGTRAFRSGIGESVRTRAGRQHRACTGPQEEANVDR